MDADPGRLWPIVITVILFVFSFYFALAETAISTVSKTRMKVRADKGSSGAKKVLYILDHFDDAITTLLILTNIAHISAAAILTVLFTRDLPTGELGVTTTLVTVITAISMFFLAEMLPKSIGKKTSEQSAIFSAGLLLILMKLLKPVSFLLTKIGEFFTKSMKKDEEQTVTENELYDIIENYREDGEISEEEENLISSALQFGDVTASSVLTPRVDVSAIDIRKTPEEIFEFIKNQNHSRILVYEESIDHIVGILQIRKFLKEYIKTGTLPSCRELLDEVYYAPMTMEIDELLSEMSKRKLNLAVITDSFGGTLGVVTVEDILEEIVGEIFDETDEIKEPIRKLSENEFLVDGDETVLDVFDFIGYTEEDEREEERFTNLLTAEFVLENFQGMPENGDSFLYHDLKITVREISHNRIYKVLFEVLPKAETEEHENGEAETEERE